MSSCAPYVKTRDNSCFTYEQLKHIATNFNKSTPVKKITIHRKKTDLWNAINSRLSSECATNDEKCWQQFNKMKDAKELFRPDMPSTWKNNPREWLSNFDIQKVMQQYETSSFKFLGVFPSDYDYKLAMNVCVAQELCNLDVLRLKAEGITELGIVFNTDPHYASGSHWVAVYVCTNPRSNKFGFYYYDSNASEPFEYIKKLHASIQSQFAGTPSVMSRFKLKINTVRHQFKNTECGMFSMHFIISMMNKKKTFDKIINEKLNDDMIFKKRQEFYYKRDTYT